MFVYIHSLCVSIILEPSKNNKGNFPSFSFCKRVNSASVQLRQSPSNGPNFVRNGISFLQKILYSKIGKKFIN